MGTFRLLDAGIVLLLESQHLPHHSIVLGHGVPVYLCTLGNHTVIRLVWVEPHIFPDLPLLLGELIRRDNPMHPVQDGLPFRVHLLDQYLQFCLTLLTGMSVDTFGMLGAIRPGRGVTALKQMVIDLGDAPGARLSLSSLHRLEVRSQVLLCLNGFLLYLVAQPTVDLGRRLGLHIPGDVGVDVQGSGRRHMAQHGGEGLHIHTALQGQGGKGVPLRYNYDKPEKPRRIKGFEVFSLVFSSFFKPKNHTERSRIAGGVSLTTNE